VGSRTGTVESRIKEHEEAKQARQGKGARGARQARQAKQASTTRNSTRSRLTFLCLSTGSGTFAGDGRRVGAGAGGESVTSSRGSAGSRPWLRPPRPPLPASAALAAVNSQPARSQMRREEERIAVNKKSAVWDLYSGS
jgi:hypothetical protein